MKNLKICLLLADNIATVLLAELLLLSLMWSETVGLRTRMV